MPIQFTGERFTKKNIRHSVLLALLIADNQPHLEAWIFIFFQLLCILQSH